MKKSAKATLELAKQIQALVNQNNQPAPKAKKSGADTVVEAALFANARPYIERVVNQVNGCYEAECYDACAVMLRKLIETLIIEMYEHHGIRSNIEDPRSGEYFYLEELIKQATNEKVKWKLARNARRALDLVKHIGDLSAHSRRWHTTQREIDDVLQHIPVLVKEFLGIANML